ncbi:hypothetical protein [Cyclobacterium plantarum]|uniref:hypothetical protein n=1 Tax=Cyclobacterium plantarum TaxID=2716263 RepID=UPI003F715BB3
MFKTYEYAVAHSKVKGYLLPAPPPSPPTFPPPQTPSLLGLPTLSEKPSPISPEAIDQSWLLGLILGFAYPILKIIENSFSKYVKLKLGIPDINNFYAVVEFNFNGGFR